MKQLKSGSEARWTVLSLGPDAESSRECRAAQVGASSLALILMPEKMFPSRSVILLCLSNLVNTIVNSSENCFDDSACL